MSRGLDAVRRPPGAARDRARCARSTTRRCSSRPTCTSPAASRRWRASATRRSRWPRRSRSARRGSGTSTSTSRRSARRRRSTPRSRSTSRRCRGRRSSRGWRAWPRARSRPTGEDGPADRPLRLEGSALYLDRYWREERQVAADLTALRERPPRRRRRGRARRGPGADLRRRDGDLLQRRAAETALRRRFTVIAGGPGTGKTTTVARILALLLEQPGPEPLIALAAPTGKAAARLVEAIRDAAGDLDGRRPRSATG